MPTLQKLLGLLWIALGALFLLALYTVLKTTIEYQETDPDLQEGFNLVPMGALATVSLIFISVSLAMGMKILRKNKRKLPLLLSSLISLSIPTTQLLQIVVFVFSIAFISPKSQAGEPLSPEVAVVVALYRDFPSEVVVAESKSTPPPFIDQPASVLKKYLAPQLVTLLLADRAFVAKSGEIGNLDFDPIWASQDPAATDLKVRLGRKPSEVEVSFLYPGEAKRIHLRFEMTQTPAGPRIQNIHYPEGPSLRAILQQKH